MSHYLYVDESGDLGFDFENKNPSHFFTITILLTHSNNDNKRLKSAVDKTVKRKLNPKNKRKRVVKELKGSETSFAVKQYFYTHCDSLNFGLYSITINKKKVNPELQSNKARLYNYILRVLIDQIDLSQISSLNLILDRCKNQKEIAECNRYLVNNISGRLIPEASINISHEDSQHIKQLQAVDVFCYGIARKYNQSDTNWFEVFRSKIVYEDLFFR